MTALDTSVPSMVWAFDCEWVPDPRAGRRLYHIGRDVPDEEVLRVMWESSPEFDRESNPQPFLKTVMCRVVSVAAVVRVASAQGPQLYLWTLPALDGGAMDEVTLLKTFLGKYCSYAQSPLLVGFNSKGSDMHILAQRAIVHGISMPRYYSQMAGKPWEMNACDLMEIVGGRTRAYNCSLNEIANLCGIPGKLDVAGDDVAGMFYGGKMREIVEYNVFDALTTYLLWLRVEHFRGAFDDAKYAAEQNLVRTLLGAEMAKPGGEYLRRYVDAWNELA